jgi:hypothetical protein
VVPPARQTQQMRHHRIAAATAVVLAGLVFAGVAVATSGPRFYTSKPRAAVKKFDTQLDHSGAFTAADCWLYGGSASAGWRHVGCVGNYNNAGTTYRFKLVATPHSCARIREVITLSGAGTKRQTVPWHHQTFSCKR